MPSDKKIEVLKKKIHQLERDLVSLNAFPFPKERIQRLKRPALLLGENCERVV
jgi:hypothetical protein